LHDCAQALSSRFFVTNIQKLLVTDLIVTSSFFRPKATKAFIVVFVNHQVFSILLAHFFD